MGKFTLRMIIIIGLLALGNLLFPAYADAQALPAESQPDEGEQQYLYLPMVLNYWPPVPYKPTLNNITGAEDGDFTLSWTESPSRLADTYTVEEATDSGFTQNLRTACNTSQQSCAVTGKTMGTFYYRVRGVNQYGAGQWSNVQAVVVSPILLGQYSSYGGTDFWTEQTKLDEFVTGTVGGRSSSLIGFFYTTDQNQAWVTDHLISIWNGGYVPFINLYRYGYSMYQIANGALDGEITAWAQRFKAYSDPNGDGVADRFAFIAPFQEMNGDWVSYGLDPTNYINGFKRIQNIFKNQGVPKRAVSWVFAPNGWSPNNKPLFEAYYPGDAYVDVVAMSSYNFGYCIGGVWEAPNVVFNNPNLGSRGYYLDRMNAMAPTKPLFIAQTASGDYSKPGVASWTDKNNWMLTAYTYLAGYPQVQGVVYFNVNDPPGQPCHFRLFGVNPAVTFPGYRDAVNANLRFKYINPSTLKGLAGFFTSTLP